jgi:hypothetical protein
MNAVIDRRKLIVTRDIPIGTDQVVVITYLEKSLVVSLKDYEQGAYRMEFIKKFGIPLPKPPALVQEVFSPNLLDLVEEKCQQLSDIPSS